jgi:hypothetical protein
LPIAACDPVLPVSSRSSSRFELGKHRHSHYL